MGPRGVRRLAAAIVAAALMAAPATAQEVTVFAVASLKNALDAVSAAWQAATGALPYRWSIRLQKAGVRLHRYVGSSRYREALRLARAVLPPDHRAREVRAVALGSLAGSTFTGWRLRAIGALSPTALDRTVRIVGGERLPEPGRVRR